MGTSAQLTVLWGTTPIALAHVTEGRAVSVSDAGIVVRAPEDRSAPGALTVRVDAHGATVLTGGVAGARSVVDVGTEARFSLSQRPGTVYRAGNGSLPEALGLHVAVMATEAKHLRRRPWARRAWLATACSAMAHGLALATSAAAAPPPALARGESRSLLVGPLAPEAPPLESAESPIDVPEEDVASPKPHMCGPQEGPIVGRTISVRGPSDNPDPHIARRHAPPPNVPLDALGALRGGGDPIAPTAPWGRDDALGADERSEMGALPGESHGHCAFNTLWSCFDDPHGRWSCSGDLPEPPNVEHLGLSGIGDALAASPDQPKKRRPAPVALGPAGVWANVPRGIVLEALRSTLEDVRACYERALLDAPGLGGKMDVVLRVRGYDSDVELTSRGELSTASALRCCVEQTQHTARYELPTGTSANALYSILFGAQKR